LIDRLGGETKIDALALFPIQKIPQGGEKDPLQFLGKGGLIIAHLGSSRPMEG